MINGIHFDWGGVLIENVGEVINDYIAKELGVDPKKVFEIRMRYDFEFAENKVKEEQIWKEVCGECGTSYNVKNGRSLWKEAFASVYSPRKEMFELVEKLKGNGYKVGLLSNTELPSAELFLERHVGLFDSTVFSCQEGITKPRVRFGIKPNLKIYETAIQRLGVPASESVFIDDREWCLESARLAGLNGILYKCYEQVRDELRGLGVRIDS